MWKIYHKNKFAQNFIDFCKILIGSKIPAMPRWEWHINTLIHTILKLVSTIFYQIFIFHQIIAHQKL